jgi:uncharacterized membrane protein YraQ (UPF0718 family)
MAGRLDAAKRWTIPALVALSCVALALVPGEALPGGAAGAALGAARGFLRQHFLFALVPALLMAGAIASLVDREAIVRHLGAGAWAAGAFALASVAGGTVTVCSCMVLPLFAGIQRRGAGLGPALTFLYCGPAINVLAVVLTASMLGVRMAAARAVAALGLGLGIGLAMQGLFGRGRSPELAAGAPEAGGGGRGRGLRAAVVLGLMVAATLSLNWARTGRVRAVLLCCPGGEKVLRLEGRVLGGVEGGVRIVDDWGEVHEVPDWQIRSLERERGAAGGVRGWVQWTVFGACVAGLVAALAGLCGRSDLRELAGESWTFGRRIVPLLLLGVLLTGLLFGHGSRAGLVPRRWIEASVGGGGPGATVTASVAGALMYFATLTEVPILRGLLDAGMGWGPALALLLAGPSVSLPTLLVVRDLIGTKRTAAYLALVVLGSVVAGLVYGGG